jgi:tetraacyldisaccharide 4'-kinase
MARELARIARDAGETPAIVLRGYRGSIRRGAARVPPPEGPAQVRRYGDEACLHAQEGLAQVYVARNRIDGVCRAAEEGATLAILDDGMQHRSLDRDLEIVALPAVRPLANRRLLPRGPLREPVSALQRADLIILTYAPRNGVDPRTVEVLHGECPRVEIAAWRAMVQVRPYDGHERVEELPSGSRVGLFCGIGNPGIFRRSVEELDCRVAWVETFADHHNYREQDLESIWERAAESQVEAILTTSKDAIRLRGLVRRGRPPLYIAQIRICWERDYEERVRSAMLRTLRSS